MSNFKLFVVRRLKFTFFFFRLHYLFKPFRGFLMQLLYLTDLSEWVHRNRRNMYYEGWTLNWNYRKRQQLYEYLIANHGLCEAIDYLEFGVYRGDSMKWWVKHNIHPDSRFCGFDTFEGLPEDFGVFRKGTMSADNRFPDINDSRVDFVKGLFQDSLPGYLQTFQRRHRLVLHLDADLFSSTLYVLSTLTPHLRPGDILIFDEFAVPKDEFLAFKIYTSTFYKELKPIIGLNNFLFCAFEVK